MRVFLDTEFLNRGAGHPIDLISVGMVDEAGREFYGINVDSPLSLMAVDTFMRKNIWPTLPLHPVTGAGILDWDPLHHDIANVFKPETLREHVYQFLVQDGPPEVWVSFGAFDYVVVKQMFGKFDDDRAGLPNFFHDIQQVFSPSAGLWEKVAIANGRGRRPRQTNAKHHALEDARHLRDVFNWMFGGGEAHDA
jgi:hypothetical protein